MTKKNVEPIANIIFDSKNKVTFPVLMAAMEENGINPYGDLDYLSRQIKNCIYWRGLSQNALDILDAIQKFYRVTLQPYGYNPEGVRFYKEKFPDMPVFNHFLIEKMKPATQKKFMSVPYMMPVYFVPTKDAVYIQKPGC